MFELFDANVFVISVVCLFAPLIQCLTLQRELQAHTFVAMLRGYAAHIEKTVNDMIGADEFIYNSKLIDEYIASQKVVESKGIKISWFMTALMHYAILVVCVAFWVYYNFEAGWWGHVWAGIWYVGVAALITKLCVDFGKKERKRLKAKEFADKK